jgi:hypothetical protein
MRMTRQSRKPCETGCEEVKQISETLAEMQRSGWRFCGEVIKDA